MYEMRTLRAQDLFLVLRLLSRIGIREFHGCLEAPAVTELIEHRNQAQPEDADSPGDLLFRIGASAALEIADKLISNLPRCETELYALLAALTGESVQTIRDMPPAAFLEQIAALVRKEEFRDFFGAASGLLKKEK